MKFEKVEKLVSNLHDKTEYVIHIRNLKQVLNHGLILKKVHRVVKFNKKAGLGPYIDTNTKLRQKAKNNFEKYFFKLMNNEVFRKNMENVRKNIEILNLQQQKEEEIIYYKSQIIILLSYTEYVLAKEMRKTQILMNEPVYLGLSILDLTETVMYEFWYDYIKPKYDENAELCYMDTDSFIVCVKTDDILSHCRRCWNKV